jgi:hypothetical protein
MKKAEHNIFKMEHFGNKIALAICLLIGLQVFGQQNVKDVEAAFHEYSKGALTEKVFAHTDKTSPERSFGSGYM